ncbi:phosphoribosylformylglycinamidine synthase, purS protein [Leptospirillum ferriphilum]|jgi:phosphoribosylformylglycinamidine synthase|uniref:Phosphoribosylformylglycinamidine synthase subunit PurS n=3 Tax=Leptospirillum ferriphilum TaxID=178606 RepID=A0A059XUJ8_9BACT|nr:phosphoribosylformylglycinamidine synthase [Leptospirillum ferriphilum YSK]AKS24752.1 phosphoribosylformylglycinamidine synthase, PurS component [Leptospirillum sp. Group II 'CF-1']OOH71284.1 phosphoribosylformylglycinamidine synthase, purS protein [Leptospirillum ferriphilum]OOH84284.1 phosphoribosylformylglycinamidine synthase, purS protein [Leptospirillum ferriphilum]
MVKATILIRVREGILDPQGQAVLQVLHDMGENGVQDVRIGKIVEILLPESLASSGKIDSWCAGFLANPLVESFEIRSIEPALRSPVSA